ncbi:MAG: GABA permease, partial [Gammaproteobacteria bacterium]|nr:GABA permease [Gammaproteobacteria bacterium]
MWLYPALTVITIVTMVVMIAAMAFIGEQRLPLVFGLLSALAMLAGFGLRRVFGTRPAEQPA